MSYKILSLSLLSFLVVACGEGFERFAPPANSITGRGAKQNPKILSTTPADGATVSPVTSSTGTQIKVIFDMTMNPGTTPVINTYVRDIASNSLTWLNVSNSGATFTWSSTNFANDTLTIQLGWVRWPEDNVIGFDFNNDTLINLDDMPLSNSTRFYFTVGWDPGKYKIVQTGQYACYRYEVGTGWVEEGDCGYSGNGGGGVLGTQNYPAAQNGFVDSRNFQYVAPLYGTARGPFVGRRFVHTGHPQNLIVANCNNNASDPCYPYSADSVTALVWKTCSQGQTYQDTGDKCYNSGNDYTWGEAVNACAAMNTADNGQGYGGRKDWRLPTVQELENLVDYGTRITVGKAEPGAGYYEGPAISGYHESSLGFTWLGPFPNTPVTNSYWTATGLAALSGGVTYYGNAYVVEFKKGMVGAGSTGMMDSRRMTANRKKVRCVAGPTVLPASPSLTPAVKAAGAALATTSAGFTGFDSNATFNVLSAVAAHDMAAGQYTIQVTYNITPNVSQAGVPGNYCVAAPGAALCGPSSPTISSAVLNGNVVTLTTAAQSPNMPYQLFVTGVTSSVASLPLTTDRVFFSGATSIDSRAATSVFNARSAVSPNLSSVQLTFDRLPDPVQAVDATRYKITDQASIPSTFAASTTVVAITGATLSGNTVTLSAALAGGTKYVVKVNNVTLAGAQVVNDTVNKLRWQRCRRGNYDNATCSDDGDSSNDAMYWNDALNYCASLNAINYDGDSATSSTDPYGWRAPTINELKYIANRALFGTLGYSIDTTIFPTPNPLAENFSSGTNYSLNGTTVPGNALLGYPNYNTAWAFNYAAGTSGTVQKDDSTLGSTQKPQPASIRCVRNLP